MGYYNRNLHRLKLKRKKLEWLNCGMNAQVFRYDDIVFKEYRSEASASYRLKPEVFDILRDIDNDHFIQLLDIYSDMDLLELLIYMCNKNYFQVDSYIAKYYPKDAINVLEEPVDYILDNFRELDLLFDIFTDNGVRTDDIKRENAVISCNGIVIIDPDCFAISKESKSILKIQNKKKLLHLFKSICLDNVGCYANFGKIKVKINESFNDSNIDENTDIAHEISKELKYVKKPIDYFRK